MNVLPFGTRCGIHGDPTHTGRCASCDASPPALYPRTYRTAAEARDAAIDWQSQMSEWSLSYSELYEWQTHWEQTLILFPELADEFRENGIC